MHPANEKILQRRGNSIAEIALVLPILLMLAFGVVDYGDFLYLKNTFQAAALAGARAAVPFAATNSNVTGTSGIVTKMMTSAGFSPSQYTVTLSPSDISQLPTGTPITVTVSANWSAVGTQVLAASFGGISSSRQVSSNAVMQKEAN
jgi:Flp pilus assembly protein TadG